jgi:plastocyanin
MNRTSIATALMTLLAATWLVDRLPVEAQVNGNDNNIAVMDTCDPGDEAWDMTGGCSQKQQRGDVTNAEFGMLLRSPLTIPANGALIGHPAWRNEPSHVTANAGRTVRVVNRGGRGHTFTEVTDFGGGFIGQLNVGLTPAPQCLDQASIVALAPGATQQLNLAPGLHKFQCCIHPWMRATIRVE